MKIKVLSLTMPHLKIQAKAFCPQKSQGFLPRLVAKVQELRH